MSKIVGVLFIAVITLVANARAKAMDKSYELDSCIEGIDEVIEKISEAFETQEKLLDEEVKPNVIEIKNEMVHKLQAFLNTVTKSDVGDSELRNISEISKRCSYLIGLGLESLGSVEPFLNPLLKDDENEDDFDYSEGDDEDMFSR